MEAQPTLHWMERQVGELQALAQAHRTAVLQVAGPPGSPRVLAEQKRAYQSFVTAVREVVSAVAGRPGVTACFACHEGLVLETAGRPANFEALAATTQACVSAGAEAARAVSLGQVQQLVIIGEQHKLALFLVGQLALGVLSPVSVSLASSLAR